MTLEGCFGGLSVLFERRGQDWGARKESSTRHGDHSAASKEGKGIPRKTAPGSTDTAPSLFDIKRVEPHLASAIQEK
jgi:hypothetical protein